MEVVRSQIRETSGLERLRPILKEFGEYPEMQRSLIWRTILQLPENQSSYVSLVNRGYNPAYSRLEVSQPLENKATLKNFKRLLSNLAHCSPIFGEAQYIPMFVFPFVRVFQNDPTVCFEAVATIHGISVRSADYYSREKWAVQSEGLLSADGVWEMR